MAAGSWLTTAWKRARKSNPTLPRPRPVDIIRQASGEVIIRALDHEVDAVLVISAMYLHPQALVHCQRAGIPAGIIFTESPYDDEHQARVAGLAGVCWTNERSSVARLRQANPSTHYLPAAFDPVRHQPGARPGDQDLPAHDVVFVGTYFKERLELLASVDWTGIDLGLYGQTDQITRQTRAGRALHSFIRGGITGNATTAALYRRAKIGLNLYRTSKDWGGRERVEHAESLNPRAYELAATGCFHLSSAREEVAGVFAHGVPTFEDGQELEALIRRFLADDDRRVAHAGVARTRVQPHTFAARAAQVVEQLTAATAPPVDTDS